MYQVESHSNITVIHDLPELALISSPDSIRVPPSEIRHLVLTVAWTKVISAISMPYTNLIINPSIFRVDESSSADNIISSRIPWKIRVSQEPRSTAGRQMCSAQIRWGNFETDLIVEWLNRPSDDCISFFFRLHIKHFSQKAVNYKNISCRTLEKGVLSTRKWLVLEL